MAEVVVIDGREFAVGDAVLTHWRCALTRKWLAGVIEEVRGNGWAYRIKVLCVDGSSRLCMPDEVHSIRENFA